MTTEEVIAILCRNVCYLRKKYQLSQESMAMSMQIDVKDLQLMEAGVLSDEVTADTLIRLQKVFRISISTLFSTVLEETESRTTR